MNGADVFYIIRKGTSGGTVDDLDGEPTARIIPEFSQCRFVVENGVTTLWQLSYGTDADNVSGGIKRPRDYNALTNAKVWKRILDSGGVKTVTKILTNAQIKALPTTPIVIVPATEVLNYSGFPSKLFFPVSAYGVLDNTAGAYTNDGTGNLVLLVGTDGYSSNINVGIAASSTSYATPMQFNPWSLSDLGFVDADKTFFSFIVGQFSPLRSSNLYDNALVLQIAGANPITDGDSANTLKIVVQYLEVTIP